VEEHQRTLLAAQGYCELEMYRDAIAELHTLPEETQQHPMVLEMRLVILMQAKHWEEGLETSRQLYAVKPDGDAGYIHAAFCLHELGRTDEARTVLLSGPESLHTDATYHYNLACYECILGNVDLARAHLDRSVQLDKKFKNYAKTDPDLAGLREAV
jgi:tetratricopeptide (TPR) repeat protein